MLIKPNYDPTGLKLPFFGRASSKNYGSFYDGVKEPFKTTQNVNIPSAKNLLGPSIKKDFKSTTMDDYKKYQKGLLEPIEKQLPENNLFTDNEPFLHKYMSA